MNTYLASEQLLPCWEVSNFFCITSVIDRRELFFCSAISSSFAEIVIRERSCNHTLTHYYPEVVRFVRCTQILFLYLLNASVHWSDSEGA